CDTPSKDMVRAEAEERGLSVAQKPDSHDICFIPDGDTRGWLEEKIEMSDGPIVDTEGDEVGTHPGAQAFTIGQRRGLGIGKPAGDGKPRFVLEIRPKDNTVVVGSRDMLAVDRITGISPSWAGAPIAEESTGERFSSHLQVHAHSEPVPGRARVTTGDVDGTTAVVWEMELDDTTQGVAAGQTAVVYQGTRVLGQVTIHKSINAE